MKKLIVLMAVAFIIISSVMVYLIKDGVSLRTAPYIRPSIINENFDIVPYAVFKRLFLEWNNIRYVFWDFPETHEAQQTLVEIQRRFNKELKTQINILNAEDLSAEALVACEKPCWVFANEPASVMGKKNPWLSAIQDSYITITWVPFHRQMKVPTTCMKEKILEIDCLLPTAVKDVERRLREPNKKYFFMRKYLDHDFFLFIEEPHQ